LTNRALHLNLDNAWRDEPFGLPVADAQDWGARLRFSAPSQVVEQFYRENEQHLTTSYLLYGSGDFHYLTALRLRRIGEPIVLVSFDNHPDWDVRPPRWGCGGWINRALELLHVRRASVWGCGNFECWWPHQIFGNRRAERAGTLEVHPWADDRPVKDRERRGAILRANWRDRFEQFLNRLASQSVYITIDIDCLRKEEAVTNWESGRFAILDLEWALKKLRESSRIVGGDICGAYSPPTYARWKQRFAGEFDHPKIDLPDEASIRGTNLAALATLWPLLSGSL
jgi:arginase family enzyme